MNWRQVRMIFLTIIPLLITALLLPITVNISTGYLSALPSGAEIWIKRHIIWFWASTVIFGFALVVLGGVTTYLQLTKGSSSLSFSGISDFATDGVNTAADMATQDPMLTRYNDRFSKLDDWKRLAEFLITAYYSDYVLFKDKKSKYAAAQIADLLEKLLKHTRRSFVYLNKASDFAAIAKQAYFIAFAHARWKYAADLSYNVGRVYYELGKYGKDDVRTWISALRTCLEKAKSARIFGRYWTKIYNEMRPDGPGALDRPTDPKAQESFYEALMYAAKLYDLEGLSKNNDVEAKAYFEKALTRAQGLPDKVLYSRIKIHIAKLACRLHLDPVIYYNDALAVLDPLNLKALDPLQRSDVVNLKLTCYYQLGSLSLPYQSRGWYQKQVALAQEYGALDFQVLGHIQLAEIALRQGLDQSSPGQIQSFQTAYKHVRQAWVINDCFGDVEAEVIEPKKLARLTLALMDKSV